MAVYPDRGNRERDQRVRRSKPPCRRSCGVALNQR